MILIKFISNFDDVELYDTFLSVIKHLTAPDVSCEMLDTGSKKDIKEALSYFSRYASTNTFVVIEDESLADDKEKVIGVVYKESIKELSDWKILIENKIKTYNNEK